MTEAELLEWLESDIDPEETCVCGCGTKVVEIIDFFMSRDSEDEKLNNTMPGGKP